VVILFDFDGVLMDSMPIREVGFRKVLSGFPAHQIEKLINYHRENGGLSRYAKFEYFFNEIRKEEASSETIYKMADDFSKIMLDSLINPNLLIQDSLSFVKNNYERFPMHIVSGSDEKELKIICRRVNIYGYFVSIHGSPAPKDSLINKVITNRDYNRNEIVFVGDSYNDLEAARKNYIHFTAFNNSDLRREGIAYIDSFSQFNYLVEKWFSKE